MYSFLNRNLIYPFYFAINKDKRLKHLRKIEKLQWLSPDEICHRQLMAFKKILNYAYNEIPFYTKLYKSAGLTPNDIENIDDIKKIPIISKKNIQENLKDFTSSSCPDNYKFKETSGGSTGRPTIFYLDKRSMYTKFAANLLTDKWTGWNIGEKVAYLWGADRDILPTTDLKAYVVERFVFRQCTLNSFAVTDEKMRAFAKDLVKKPPALIVAYANSAYQFAGFIDENNIKGIYPKGIVCSAETLAEDKRLFIEQVFHCKVLNRYGSRELGVIAAECEKQEGLHINANDVFVEMMEKNNSSFQDELSEIIVTDFNNYVMPFIRYNTGDIASSTKKKCSCGRGFPLIKKVHGRTSDFIVHANGNRIHGEAFSHAFYGMKGISQFQIIQNNINKIELKIVPNQFYASQDKQVIIGKIYDILGKSVDINYIKVESIPVPVSGKFRFVINNIEENPV